MKLMMLAIAVLLTGCASGHYWTKPDSTETQFQRDYYQCMKEFRGSGGSKYDRNVAFEERCLGAQGYTRSDVAPDTHARWRPF